jgi:membrane peptidoglycan carboxypeptidase
MLLAFFLEFRLSKLTILRSYLAIAYFGSGITGVEQTASKVFGKAAEQLSEREAAFLAAMLVYPRPLTPTASWEARVCRRAEYGLVLLRRKGAAVQKATSTETI